ncbi:MAG: ParB/RepB/Spo0J family partition protein [Deltaproteobacteria bacterium]|nr:ParB/RepB/Spo0J family partition protein [Deltaproteobacteria bacterium]
MSDLNADSKKRGLGRGLGSLLGDGSGGLSSGLSRLDSHKELSSHQNHNESKKRAISARLGIQNSEEQNKIETNRISKDSVAIQGLNTDGKVWKVSVEKLKPGAYQPRKTFNKEKIEELSLSIKQSGILQPIIVRKKDEGFEIIAGERRWRAAQAAGLHEVPVLIKNYTDKETLELSIVENIQREDLSPIEEAEGYSRLINEFSLSHQQIAEKVGKDRSSVSNAIRLLALPIEIRKYIENSDISVGHAKILLSVVDKNRQIELADLCKNEKISVRKLEKLAMKSPENKSESKDNTLLQSSLSDRLINGLGEEMQKLLGTKVNIDYNGTKGKLSIYFYSDEELTGIIDKLKAGCQL